MSRSDPVDEYLDRAWELQQGGDLTGALEQYRAAIAADPEYAAPVIKTAELHLYSMDEPKEALELAQRGLALAEFDDDRADAVVVIAESELALGRPDAARLAVEQVAALGVDDPAVHCRAGELLFELGDVARAERHYRAAVERDDSFGDAHHGLGVVCETRGDIGGARAAWLKVRKLDLAAPRAPWTVPEAEFERVAEQAFDALPSQVRERLENVPILMADYPSIEIVADGNDPRMLGYFAGVPYGQKENIGTASTQPDCIVLYQRNIENACPTASDLEREIAITLWHETAHFFGLEDDDLAPLGLA